MLQAISRVASSSDLRLSQDSSRSSSTRQRCDAVIGLKGSEPTPDDIIQYTLTRRETEILTTLARGTPCPLLEDIDTDRKFTDHFSIVSDPKTGAPMILGSGVYGTVYLCVDRSDDSKSGLLSKLRLSSSKSTGAMSDHKFAAKRIDKTKMIDASQSVKVRVRYLRSMRNEVGMLRRINQCVGYGKKYLVKLVDVFEDDKEIVIVTEHYSGGELFKYLKSKVLSEGEVKRITAQICQGMDVIHGECSGVHCDLKPENILFSDETHSSIRVIDLGMARVIESGQVLSDPCGSAYYTAPEVINTRSRKAAYSQPCDVWALGCLVFVLLFGFPPFAIDASKYTDVTTMKRAIYRNILEGFFPRVYSAASVGYGPWFPDTFPKSELAYDFVSLCLEQKPGDRPSMSELVRHPWLVTKSDDQSALSLPSLMSPSVKAAASVFPSPTLPKPLTEDEMRLHIRRMIVNFERRRWDFREIVARIATEQVISAWPQLFDCLIKMFREMVRDTQKRTKSTDDCADYHGFARVLGLSSVEHGLRMWSKMTKCDVFGEKKARVLCLDDLMTAVVIDYINSVPNCIDIAFDYLCVLCEQLNTDSTDDEVRGSIAFGRVDHCSSRLPSKDDKIIDLSVLVKYLRAHGHCRGDHCSDDDDYWSAVLAQLSTRIDLDSFSLARDDFAAIFLALYV